jgi:hypothetical protein
MFIKLILIIESNNRFKENINGPDKIRKHSS